MTTHLLAPNIPMSTVQNILEDSKLGYQYAQDGELEVITANLLQQGYIVGWFQGRMEIGHPSFG